jgi:hypothetical protein
MTDGEQLIASQRFARGGPIYVRIDRPPYTPALYGPLFYISLGTIDLAAKPPDLREFAFEGRTFIFACYLLIALVAWRLARLTCGMDWPALAAPLFILADRAYYPYAATLRPDIPALLFSLLGFFVICRDADDPWPRVAGAGILMGLGFLFKQPFLAAPAAVFFWLIWKRHHRSAAVLTAAALLPVIAVIGWLELGGEPVLYSLLMTRHTIYDIRGELVLIGDLLLGSPTAILAVALGLAGLASLWKRDRERALLLLLYLCFAAAVGLLTMAQVGAARYYLGEVLSLCAILAPAGLELWVEQLAASRPDMRLGSAILLLGIPCLSLATWWPAPHPPDYQALVSKLAGHRILSTVPLVAAQGKNPEMIDPWVNTLLERTGEWSPKPVLRQIRAEEFDYVVVSVRRSTHGPPVIPSSYRGVPRLSPPIMQQVRGSYRLAGACLNGAVVIFVPKKKLRGSQLAARLAPVCGWSRARFTPHNRP